MFSKIVPEMQRERAPPCKLYSIWALLREEEKMQTLIVKVYINLPVSCAGSYKLNYSTTVTYLAVKSECC
jgi:hypothetical protein